MLSLPPITLRLRSFKLIDRVALAFLLLCSILFGVACGLLFVYASDLPEIRAPFFRPIEAALRTPDWEQAAAVRVSGTGNPVWR